MKFYTDVFVARNQIYTRGYNNGKRYQQKIDYKPYLFVPSKKEDASFKSLFNKKLEKFQFDSINDAKDFTKKYSNVSGFEIYGMTHYEYPFINDYFPDEVQFDVNRLSIGFIDIEVDSSDGFPEVLEAKREVTAISIKRKDLIVSLGLKPYEAKEGVLYIQCRDEEHLLSKFLQIWKHLDLDIITGWNIEFFDIPYLINRIKKVLGENRAKEISPWNMISDSTIDMLGKMQQTYTIRGICILDYLHLYKKFTYTARESYRLDYIAHIEIGKKKLDYSEYENLTDLYERDFSKYIDYNIHDTCLVEEIDNKLNLISLAITLAYDSKINYGDVFSPIKLWDVIIHNFLMKNNVAINFKSNNAKNDKFVGAYVKDPIVGMHNYVASFDVESLYPSLIVQYNISPETYRGKLSTLFTTEELLDNTLSKTQIPNYLLQNNLALTANSCLWDRDIKGVFPQLVELMMSDRKKYKNIMLEAKKEYEVTKTEALKNKISKYDNLQMSKKIALNSLYGALGNNYFRWFEIDFAEAITTTGRLAIRWTENNLNNFLNRKCNTSIDRVIAIDTDSVYLNLKDLVDPKVKNKIDYLDTLCKEIITPKIDDSFKSLVEYTNAYTPFLKMKREVLADKGIWTAKKRYILNVYDNEGVRYSEPELKMVGIEGIRSSTPEPCRNKIKQAIKLIMEKNEDDVIDFIQNYRKEFMTLSFTDIAFSVTCNGINEYASKDTIFRKSTPIHVRGALVFNHALKTKNLDTKYESIKNGEKIKYCHLKLPNPVHQDIISVNDVLPAEFNLSTYIDYDTQFEKTFLEPLRKILDIIGYKIEKTNTLESFFE